MEGRVFFIFDYGRDRWKAEQIHDHLVSKLNQQACGLAAEPEWEKMEENGEEAIKEWINWGLNSSIVTIVLFSSETSKLKYIDYAIEQSFKRKKGLVGIDVHNMKNDVGDKDSEGKNPFKKFYVKKGKEKIYLKRIFPTYEWINDLGYNNINEWVEGIAKAIKE
jgi:hypothetical protein